MDTTNFISQCLCHVHAKEEESPQGWSVMVIVQKVQRHWSWLRIIIYSSGIIDFMIEGSECLATISNSFPHECQMFSFEFSDTLTLKSKEETHLSDLRVEFTFIAFPRALAPSTDILLLWRLERKNKHVIPTLYACWIIISTNVYYAIMQQQLHVL